MSRGMPSMIALLGLLAVAGYQNRDKIADMLGGLKEQPAGGSGMNSQQSGLGGMLGAAYHRRADAVIATGPAVVDGDADVDVARADYSGRHAVR